MANPFYTASGAPTTSSPGASATIRAEFALLAAAFDKLPTTLTANKAVVINSGGTGMTLTTGSLALAGNFTTTGAFNTVFAQQLSATFTLPNVAADTLVSRTSTDTMTNKTLTGPVMTAPVLGTPASGTLTNCTGLPVASGVSGLGTGVATFLATPTSANLLAALTDETGTGANVFATSPTLVTPLLGTPTSGTLTNCTGLPVTTGISGLGTGVATFLATPSSANLLAALTTKTGTGSAVFSISPTFTGTVNFNSLAASNGSTTGNFDIGGNSIITGLLAVHTALGGWDGSGIIAGLSANPGASVFIADVGGSTGYCFNGRMNTTGGNFAGWNYNGSYVGSITSNGTSTSYNTSSDARLKTNITDAPDTGAIIDGLRVRSWNWTINGAHESYGFVAQEEFLVAPFAVRAGDDHPTDITTQWGRDDSKLVPVLVKEIQSLRARLSAAGL